MTSLLLQRNGNQRGSRFDHVRQPCDLCCYPCPFARVALTHKGLVGCFHCCLAQPRYFREAKIQLDAQYKELEQLAEDLRIELPPAESTEEVRLPEEDKCGGEHA